MLGGNVFLSQNLPPTDVNSKVLFSWLGSTVHAIVAPTRQMHSPRNSILFFILERPNQFSSKVGQRRESYFGGER